MRLSEEIGIICPPGEHTPHPDGIEHEPGSYPEPVIRDPNKWKGSDRLSKGEKKLVVYCWNLAAALKSYEIEEVKRTAKEYVDLLDYEKIHGQDFGSYSGDEGDVTLICFSSLIALGEMSRVSSQVLIICLRLALPPLANSEFITRYLM